MRTNLSDNLINAIAQKHDVLDELSKAHFITDLFRCSMKESGINEHIDWNFVDFLKNNSDYGPWYALEMSLLYVHDLLDIPEHKAALKSAIERQEILLNASTNNWANFFKSVIIWDLACKVEDPRCLKEANRTFVEFIDKCGNSTEDLGRCNELRPDFRLAQFCYGLKQNPSMKPNMEQMLKKFNSEFPYMYYGEESFAIRNALFNCLPKNNL